MSDCQIKWQGRWHGFAYCCNDLGLMQKIFKSQGRNPRKRGAKERGTHLRDDNRRQSSVSCQRIPSISSGLLHQRQRQKHSSHYHIQQPGGHFRDLNSSETRSLALMQKRISGLVNMKQFWDLLKTEIMALKKESQVYLSRCVCVKNNDCHFIIRALETWGSEREVRFQCRVKGKSGWHTGLAMFLIPWLSHWLSSSGRFSLLHVWGSPLPGFPFYWFRTQSLM